MKRKKPRYDNPFHMHRGQKPGLGGVHKAIVETAAMGFDVIAERLEERAQRKDAQRDQRIDKNVQEVRAERCAGRALLAHQAVREAEKLLAVAEDTGRSGKLWKDACHKAGMSTRTAVNLLTLWDLHDRKPALFAVLACLGRTKLYQLARLPKEALRKLKPETVVTVNGSKKTLKELTDRELAAYLRIACPVAKRKRRSGLRKRVLEAIEIALDEDKMAKYTRPELDFVLEKTHQFAGMIEEALKNTA